MPCGPHPGSHCGDDSHAARHLYYVIGRYRDPLRRLSCPHLADRDTEARQSSATLPCPAASERTSAVSCHALASETPGPPHPVAPAGPGRYRGSLFFPRAGTVRARLGTAGGRAFELTLIRNKTKRDTFHIKAEGLGLGGGALAGLAMAGWVLAGKCQEVARDGLAGHWRKGTRPHKACGVVGGQRSRLQLPLEDCD